MTTDIKQFKYDNVSEDVKFVETVRVNKDVTCDVYFYINDTKKDLGIIHIQKGGKTPLQKVLKGKQTIEGYISGKGKLTIIRKNRNTETYIFDRIIQKHPNVSVMIGDTMQWQADKNSPLEVYEICFPPYEDGRYKNI